MIPNIVYFATYYLGKDSTKWSKIKGEYKLTKPEINYLKKQAQIHRDLDNDFQRKSVRAKHEIKRVVGDHTQPKDTKKQNQELW